MRREPRTPRGDESFSPGVRPTGEKTSALNDAKQTSQRCVKSDNVEPSVRNRFTKFSFSRRKILSELSSDSPAVPKIDEEEAEEEEEALVSSAASIYQTSSGQYSQYTHEQGY